MENEKKKLDLSGVKNFLKKAGCFFKKLYRMIVGFVAFIGIVAIVVVVLFSRAKIQNLETQLNVAREETSHVEITDIHIEHKLEQISELATYSYTYSNYKEVENTRTLWGMDIPGTKNKLEITYSGVIKAGFDEIPTPEVDETRKQIKFVLPEAKVLDNYIILDELQTTDKNNIFNPIGSAQVVSYFSEIQEDEQARAIEEGLLTKAEENAKTIIKNFFAEFEEYEVLFLG